MIRDCLEHKVYAHIFPVHDWEENVDFFPVNLMLYYFSVFQCAGKSQFFSSKAVSFSGVTFWSSMQGGKFSVHHCQGKWHLIQFHLRLCDWQGKNQFHELKRRLCFLLYVTGQGRKFFFLAWLLQNEKFLTTPAQSCSTWRDKEMGAEYKCQASNYSTIVDVSSCKLIFESQIIMAATHGVPLGCLGQACLPWELAIKKLQCSFAMCPKESMTILPLIQILHHTRQCIEMDVDNGDAAVRFNLATPLPT